MKCAWKLACRQFVFTASTAGNLDGPFNAVQKLLSYIFSISICRIARLEDKELMASEENQGSSAVRFTTYFTPVSTTSTAILLKERRTT